MNWKKKVGHGLGYGIDQSKQLFSGAKKQAVGIGKQTLLSIEIKGLQERRENLYGALGKEIYELLLLKGRSSVSLRTPEIKDKFIEIEGVISELSAKELLSRKEN